MNLPNRKLDGRIFERLTCVMDEDESVLLLPVLSGLYTALFLTLRPPLLALSIAYCFNRNHPTIMAVLAAYFFGILVLFVNKS